MTVWQWASLHNTRTLKPKQLNGIWPSLISLFTLVLFPLWHVKMPSLKKGFLPTSFQASAFLWKCTAVCITTALKTWSSLKTADYYLMINIHIVFLTVFQEQPDSVWHDDGAGPRGQRAVKSRRQAARPRSLSALQCSSVNSNGMSWWWD